MFLPQSTLPAHSRWNFIQNGSIWICGRCAGWGNSVTSPLQPSCSAFDLTQPEPPFVDVPLPRP